MPLVFLWTALLLTMSAPADDDPPLAAPGHLFPAGRMITLRAPHGAALLQDLPAGLIELAAPGGKASALIADWIEQEGSAPAWALLTGPVELALYETEGSRLVQRALERELLLALRPSDDTAAQAAVESLTAVADARGASIQSGIYRGQPYRRLGRELLIWPCDGGWLVTTSDELLADAIDRSLDPQAAGARRPVPEAVELGLAPGALRRRDFQGLRRQRRRLLPLETAPLLALLAGPFLDVLDAEHWTEARLEHGDAGLDLSADLPLDARPGSAPHYPDAPRPVTVPRSPSSLATLVVRRDLATWWRQREQLAAEDLQPRLARLDDAAGMAFGGRSLAEDVLDRLAPELALIVDAGDATIEAGADGPSACVVATLRDAPPGFGDVLALGFQGMIGLVNADRADAGDAPYLLGTMEHRGVLVYTARLLDPPGTDGPPAPSAAPSPSMARVDDRLLLGSSLPLVRRLVDALRDGAVDTVDAELRLTLDGSAASVALAGSRHALAARALVEQGLSPDEALGQVDTWLARLRELGRVEIALLRDEARPGLRLHGRLERTDGAR